FAGSDIGPTLTPHLLLAGLGLALLLPVIPFGLEMYALRRLTTAAFGTLMCLEPALALLAGLALLGQVPQPWALAGVALVGAAGRLLGTVPGPPGGAAEQQPLPGPGHPDEQQPPFLRGVLRGESRTRQSQGQQAALAPGQEDHVELQALGAVQGQQGDRLGP